MTDEHRYEYLIVGGGMTADSAAGGIRSVDSEGSIGIISVEQVPPYNRPPLSKGLWKGKSLDSIWRGTADLGVDLYLGRKVESVDRAQRRVIDAQGDRYQYDKLLLATGGRPRRLPFGDESILYYRSLADYQRLRELSESAHSFVVIGGGFIGSEIAAALTMNDLQVTMVFPEAGIGGVQFPAGLSAFLNDYYGEHGVQVISGESVTGLESGHEHLHVMTSGGGTLHCEAVLAGIGLVPNTELAEAAGLTVDDGVVVSPQMQTDDPDIYAAGDVARFFNPALGRAIRVEHEDNANTMGELAGKSMAGEDVTYDHLPYHYSDLFELGYEAAGTLDPGMETVEDWTDPFKKGVVYYLDGGRVRGVLLWDIWGKVDHARQLIAESGPFEATDLRGRIKAE